MLRNIENKVVTNNMNYIKCVKSDLSKLVQIAPAIDKKYLSLHIENIETKQKYPYSGVQSASIARRNARERNRVKQVNDGFNALRKRLPAAVVASLSGGARRGSGKKLSKVDTLKMVVEYIKYLQRLIDESDAALGITFETKTYVAGTSVPYEVDEGIFGGRSSPYSDSVPSPVHSECSSGVSSEYSHNNDFYMNSCPVNQDLASPIDDTELLDAITWWQQK